MWAAFVRAPQWRAITYALMIGLGAFCFSQIALAEPAGCSPKAGAERLALGYQNLDRESGQQNEPLRDKPVGDPSGSLDRTD